MKILSYRGLDTQAIPGYEKLATRLAADDFRSAGSGKTALTLEKMKDAVGDCSRRSRARSPGPIPSAPTSGASSINRPESKGRVGLLEDSDRVKHDLDRRTAASTRFAILVLHPEQKEAVRRHFRTPLVFSIHEAKGLEYENVLLYGFVSSEAKRFRDIAGDLGEDDLQGELRYARRRDKTDKSLEIYKFYINALCVAVTRAVRNLYLIEPEPAQHLCSAQRSAPGRGSSTDPVAGWARCRWGVRQQGCCHPALRTSSRRRAKRHVADPTHS